MSKLVRARGALGLVLWFVFAIVAGCGGGNGGSDGPAEPQPAPPLVDDKVPVDQEPTAPPADDSETTEPPADNNDPTDPSPAPPPAGGEDAVEPDPITPPVDEPGAGGAPLPRAQAAIIGPLAEARVAVYPVDAVEAPVWTGTTSREDALWTSGGFAIPQDALSDEQTYLVVVSGGVDLDADGDGASDAEPAANSGTLHAVATGAQLKAGPVRVTLVTEALFRRVYYLLAAQYPLNVVRAELDRRARLLIAQDVDGSGGIDGADALVWGPEAGYGALAHSAQVYATIGSRLRRDATAEPDLYWLSDHTRATFAEGVYTARSAGIGNYAYVTTYPEFSDMGPLDVYDVSAPPPPATGCMYRTVLWVFRYSISPIPASPCVLRPYRHSTRRGCLRC